MIRAPGLRAPWILALLSLAGVALGPPVCDANEDLRAPDGTPLELSRGTDPTLRSALYSFVTHYAAPVESDSALYGTVAQFEALYPDSIWEAWFGPSLTNEDGSLAWRRSRDLMALVEMHEATGDPRYLQRLWSASERVLAVRDDRLGRTDFAGKSAPAWGASVYGNVPRRAVYLVHSGMILQPLFHLLLLLDGPDSTTAVSGATTEARAALLRACLESLAHFEPAYRDQGEEGYYVSVAEERERERAPEPYNRQNVMAWNYWAAHLLTGDPAHAERARKLARFFQRRVQPTDRDFYVWEYEPPLWEHEPGARKPGEPVAMCDDVSHGYYAVEPVPRLARAGVVFTEEEVGRFARTLTRSIHWGHGIFFSSLGCQPSFSAMILRNLPGWLCLAEADPEVLPLLEGFMRRNVAAPEALHLAYLIRARTALRR